MCRAEEAKGTRGGGTVRRVKEQRKVRAQEERRRTLWKKVQSRSGRYRAEEDEEAGEGSHGAEEARKEWSRVEEGTEPRKEKKSSGRSRAEEARKE